MKSYAKRTSGQSGDPYRSLAEARGRRGRVRPLRALSRLPAPPPRRHTIAYHRHANISSPPRVPRGPRLPLYRPSAPSSGPLRASLPRDPAATLVRPHARHRTLSRRSCHPGGSDLSRETDAFGHATPIRAHELASCDDLAHRSAGRRTAAVLRLPAGRWRRQLQRPRRLHRSAYRPCRRHFFCVTRQEGAGGGEEFAPRKRCGRNL